MRILLPVIRVTVSITLPFANEELRVPETVVAATTEFFWDRLSMYPLLATSLALAGSAKLVIKLLFILTEEVNDPVVKDPDPGVVFPMDPGDAKVAPPRKLAFKLPTIVVEATESGAVPVETVETNWVP